MLLLGGCTALTGTGPGHPLMQVDWSHPPTDLLPPDGSKLIATQPSQTIGATGGSLPRSSRTDEAKALPPSFAPFRLAFTGVKGDVILRRLGEYANVKYVGDDLALSSAIMSIDLDVAGWSDVYALVGWIADASGQSVKWRGNVAVFIKKVDGAAKPSDGFLIRSSPISAELRTLAHDRFGVDCATFTGVTVCAGAVLDVEDARKFFAALEGAYGRVRWQVVATTLDVAKVVVALGLDQHVVASKVSPGRWLLAASDDRLLELVLDAVKASSGGECIAQSYRPQHVLATDLLPLVNAGFAQMCAVPVVVRNSLYWSATAEDSIRLRALVTEADHADDLARLMVIIAQENDAKRLGVVTDIHLGVPTFEAVGGVNFLLSLAKSSGWRTLEVTTSGKSNAGVNQTDRIQGDSTITTGGTQIISRKDRTVGLSVQFDGLVTATGFAGNLAITDTVLDGDTTRGSNCAGNVNVDFGIVARVCSYQRADRSASVGNAGINALRARESFVVIAALLQHEHAALDTLRLAFARPGELGGRVLVKPPHGTVTIEEELPPATDIERPGPSGGPLPAPYAAPKPEPEPVPGTAAATPLNPDGTWKLDPKIFPEGVYSVPIYARITDGHAVEGCAIYIAGCPGSIVHLPPRAGSYRKAP